MKLSLASVFFLFCIDLCAQEKFAEFDLRLEPDVRVIATSVPAGFSPAFSHLLIATKNSLKHIYVNSAGQRKEVSIHLEESENPDDLITESHPEKSLIRLYKSSKYLFHHLSDNRTTDVIYHPGHMKYYFIVTDIKTGLFSISDVFKNKDTHDVVDCYAENDEIFLITAILGKNKLLITRKKAQEKILTDTLEIEFSKEYEKTTLGKFNDAEKQHANLFIPETNLWIPPYVLNANRYTFRSGNILTMLINDNKENTWEIVIDVKRATYIIKKHESALPGKKITLSSWLTDSTLIRGYVTGDSLTLLLSNRQNSQRKQVLVINERSFKQVATTDVVKTGNFWSKSNLEYADFSDFLKKTKANKLLITGYENEGVCYLTLATKYDLISATFLANLFTLGVFDFAQTKPPSLLSFDLSYDMRSEKFNKRSAKSHVWEKMIMFLWANRSYLHSLNLNFYNGYYYIGFFDQAVKKYIVHRFFKYIE